MNDIFYKRDSNMNYAVVEIPEDFPANNYLFRMLQENTIPGVLTSQCMVENGNSYMYYLLNGKKSLSQVYGDQEISLEETSLLFHKIKQVLDSFQEYLIADSMAVFEPQYMFLDIENEELYLLVLPWEQETKEIFRPLAEFLLERMNHKDEHGINVVYNFYRHQKEAFFSLTSFLPIIEKEILLKKQEKIGFTREKEVVSVHPEPIAEPMHVPEPPLLLPTPPETVTESDLSTTPVSEGKTSSWSLAIGVICLLLGGISFGLTFLPMLNGLQKLICFGICGVSAVLAILFLILYFILRKKNGKQKSIQVTDEISIDADWMSPVSELPKQPVSLPYQETVFFDPIENGYHFTYTEHGEKKDFPLENFPVSVGKIAEENGVVIEDDTVSRIHCRFVEQDGRPALMDVNSTNGTFVNGIRLDPGEIVTLSRNDEIRIGKVKGKLR